MKNQLILSCLAGAAVTVSTSQARAEQDIHVFLSESGVKFIEQNAASYLPTELAPPDFTKSFGCMDFVQRDTVVDLSLNYLDINLMGTDTISVELEMSANAEGEIHADDLYACLGSQTCGDRISIDRARGFLEFSVSIIDGVPRVRASKLDFQLNPDDVDLDVVDCGFSGWALTKAIDFAEGWILGYLENKLIAMAEDKLAPMLEDMLGGMSLETSYVAAGIESLGFASGGLELVANAEITREKTADPCIAEFDRGGPAALEGAVPDLKSGNVSNLNFAANLGLVNGALYQLWKEGFLCMTEEHLFGLGVHLDLNTVANLLPGFPAGTELSLDIKVTRPPTLVGGDGEGASLDLALDGVIIELKGDRPDGTTNTLHAEIDVRAAASFAVHPGNNAIYATIDGVEMKRMVIEDERTSTGEGYDVVRLKELIHQAILPKMLSELGPIALTGSVFDVPGHAVILRTLESNPAYLSAGVDLFRHPKNDVGAPDTSITSVPTGVVSLAEATLRLSGQDSEVPSELLQYQVSIDGAPATSTFVRELRVGQAGQTATYSVSVAAMDLAGNTDPTPAIAEVTVDGVMPSVRVNGQRVRSGDEGPVAVSWTMSDDYSAKESLAVRVEVYELDDPADLLTARLIDSQELAPGSTSTTVELTESGGVYRVEVHASDEAGNDSTSTLLLSTASTGGCSVGGGGNSSSLLLLLAMAWLARRERRRR